MAQGPVVLFAPNLVGYVRLCLLASSILTGTGSPAVTVFLLCFNLLLDGLDGFLARRLGQASSFGAFLDVLIDNATRGVFYVWAFDSPAGVLFVLLEMLSFLCTHKGGGAAWKTGYFSNSPWWVQKVMANGFRTPQGSLTVLGLMGCPVWLWTRRWYPASVFASPFFAVPAVIGRCMAGAVEIWVIARHIQGMLREDAQAHLHQAGRKLTSYLAAN
ncbi:hypothetical protein WJX74_004121 [Apatococcus lobatus]|uniref:CDP-diacylglycerol--inositol 3-phosphatidyltransferase n=1 Tax=Apatococcus lobatus TaxID=904363 RepID=A0AAW1QAV0_9CHLO